MVNDDVMRDRDLKEVNDEDRKAEDQMVNDVSKRKRKMKNRSKKPFRLRPSVSLDSKPCGRSEHGLISINTNN